MQDERDRGIAEVSRHGDHAVVVVRGEVDMSTVGELRTALDEAITGAGRVEVDLRETTFMDSSGLAALVAAYHRLGRIHEAIVLREPCPAVHKLLDVSGLAMLVDVRPRTDG